MPDNALAISPALVAQTHALMARLLQDNPVAVELRVCRRVLGCTARPPVLAGIRTAQAVIAVCLQ